MVRRYSLRTVDLYPKQLASCIHFHNKRHPTPTGDNKVEYYLEQLALEQKLHHERKPRH
ncbi:phage integrase N-terminal SAM-like domain-containing protein [Pseudoalteromonas luteoviolacea]|uniref:phage integrase N-terminal SAM-like domain-containing protein n=1 Tax=Pseudoalteromonas luteoviolacea TaxID=43657 RepID=UPI0032B5B44F